MIPPNAFLLSSAHYFLLCWLNSLHSRSTYLSPCRLVQHSSITIPGWFQVAPGTGVTYGVHEHTLPAQKRTLKKFPDSKIPPHDFRRVTCSVHPERAGNFLSEPNKSLQGSNDRPCDIGELPSYSCRQPNVLCPLKVLYE